MCGHEWMIDSLHFRLWLFVSDLVGNSRAEDMENDVFCPRMYWRHQWAFPRKRQAYFLHFEMLCDAFPRTWVTGDTHAMSTVVCNNQGDKFTHLLVQTLIVGFHER